jgi:hypothetical protein
VNALRTAFFVILTFALLAIPISWMMLKNSAVQDESELRSAAAQLEAMLNGFDADKDPAECIEVLMQHADGPQKMRDIAASEDSFIFTDSMTAIMLWPKYGPPFKQQTVSIMEQTKSGIQRRDAPKIPPRVEITRITEDNGKLTISFKVAAIPRGVEETYGLTPGVAHQTEVADAGELANIDWFAVFKQATTSFTSLTVNVTKEDGDAVDLVTMHGEEDHSDFFASNMELTEAGELKLENLPTGTFQFRLSRHGYISETQSVTLQTGKDNRIDVQLQRTDRFRVYIKNADGTPYQGKIGVTQSAGSMSSSTEATVEEDGLLVLYDDFNQLRTFSLADGNKTSGPHELRGGPTLQSKKDRVFTHSLTMPE